MRDGIESARQGMPAVSLVTEEFWDQGNFISTSFGMPDIPRVQLPHPVAGTGNDAMRIIAEKVVPEIIAALEGSR